MKILNSNHEVIVVSSMYEKEIHQKINNESKQPKKIFGMIKIGMGCNLLFYKYDEVSDSENIHTFLMFEDYWGQYRNYYIDVLTDFFPDNPLEFSLINLDIDFINEIISLKSKRNIKCPICREISIIDFCSYKKVFLNLPDGTPEPVCCVCQENKIDIFLGKCGHAVLCEPCAKVIGKKKA